MGRLTPARGGMLLAAFALPLILAGCAAPGNASMVSVSYELDGAARTVTLHPEVQCTDRGVSGLSTADPAGQFSLLGPALDGSLGTGAGGIDDGPGLVRFDTEQIELDRDTEGVVDVAETEVVVRVYADRAESGPDYDDADGERVDGILTAHLVCAAE